QDVSLIEADNPIEAADSINEAVGKLGLDGVLELAAEMRFFENPHHCRSTQLEGGFNISTVDGIVDRASRSCAIRRFALCIEGIPHRELRIYGPTSQKERQ